MNAATVRSSGLYVWLQRRYYATLFALERTLLGTTLHEWAWRIRGITEPVRAAAHPHRAVLLEALRRFAPFDSVLEVGCHTGANLLVLARAFPHVDLSGVDVNPRAITLGRKALARAGVSRVRLDVARADDLRRLADRSVDLAVTDATLMYVGPDKIRRALAELVRVTRRAIICNEWHMVQDAPEPASRWHDMHWLHDYRRLFASLPRVAEVSTGKLPPGLYGPGDWDRYGTMIVAEMEDAVRNP
jgi:SAM-dependent methyltransferase